jgi:hypothetical protein
MDASGAWIEESTGHWPSSSAEAFLPDIQVKHAAELFMRQGGSKAQQMFSNNGKAL